MFWPGRDVRLAVINYCYSYIYRPLKLVRVYTWALQQEFGREFDEILVSDVRRKICLVYNTRLYTPAQPKVFYNYALEAMNLSWMVKFAEWKQMWRLLQGKQPQRRCFTSTSTGTYYATSFEIVDDLENRGFSIIQVHWKKRHRENENFNIEVLLDVVARTEDEYETTKALHAAIAKRYPGALLYIDCKESQAHIYRALEYTPVHSLSGEMEVVYGTAIGFQAFLAQM